MLCDGKYFPPSLHWGSCVFPSFPVYLHALGNSSHPSVHAVLPHIDEDDEANHLKVKEIVSWIFLVVYH